MGVSYTSNIVTEGLTLNLDLANPNCWSPNAFRFNSPLDLYNCFAGSNNSSCTISRETGFTSPAGGKPVKMHVTGFDPYFITYGSSPWSIADALPGQTWTVSVWMKASTSCTAGFFIFGSNSSSNYVEATNPMFNVTTEWQRFSSTMTFSNSNTRYIQVRFDGPDTGGSGIDIWYDGLQVEQNSFASPFKLYNKTWYDLSENKINFENISTDLGAYPQIVGGARSLKFTGTNYYQSISEAAAQKTDYRYGATIEMWLYSQTKSERHTVFEKIGPAHASYEHEIAMTWEPSNYISYYRHYNSYDYAGTQTLNNDAWNHVVVVLYPHLSTGTSYLNGVEYANSYVQRALMLPTQAGKIRVGTGYAGTVDTGAVGIVRTYSRMFDLEDVKQNFGAARGRFGI